MHIIKADPNEGPIDNIYYIEPDVSQAHRDLQNIHNLLVKLMSGKTGTSASELQDYGKAMDIVSENTIVTTKEQELCQTKEEAIIQGLSILIKNKRYAEVLKPLYGMFETTHYLDTVEMEKALQTLTERADLQTEIEVIFNKLLPKIASKGEKGTNHYTDIQVWRTNKTQPTGTIDTRGLLLSMTQKVQSILSSDEFSRRELFKINMRRLYLKALSIEQEKQLLNAINQRTGSDFKGVYAIENKETKQIQVTLQRDENNVKQCTIRNIATHGEAPEFTNNRDGENTEDILAVIDEQAQK